MELRQDPAAARTYQLGEHVPLGLPPAQAARPGGATGAEVELKALEYIELRTLASVASGKAPGAESSFLKLIGTEIQQKIDSLYVDAAGYYSLPYRPEQPVGEGTEIFSALRYFNYRKTTIFAGSNEIQRNIIAKHVLGL